MLRSRYTIAERSVAVRGRPSGFDFMRLGLALSIVMLHSFPTSYGPAVDTTIAEGPLRSFYRMILPMFFALSGYLVAGSLERSKTLGMFLGLRAIRIYPALAVEVFISAIVLGPIVTTVPLDTYFTDSRFFDYLLNALGDVHFSLPGVFENNPMAGIANFQLWTIPFELYCYCALTITALLGIRRWRAIGPLFVIFVTVGYLFLTMARHGGEIIPVIGAINGALLISTFLAGVSIYFYRDILPWNLAWGGGALVIAMALLSVVPFGDFFAPAPVAFATVYLGHLNPTRKWLRGADYSYGIYLYGFPIQQTIVDLFPAARVWYINNIICIPLIIIVAAASWRFVERPANNLRSILKMLENLYLSSNFRRRENHSKLPAIKH